MFGARFPKSRIEKYCSKVCWSKRRPQDKRHCLGCKKQFETYQRKQQFCSLECRDVNFTQRKAECANAWKGDKASYSAIHKWIAYTFEKLDACEHCKINTNLDWANKSGRYLREREDWLVLCRKCHKKYDMMKREDPKYCTVILDRWEKLTNQKAIKL